jgi:hypothetical protein
MWKLKNIIRLKAQVSFQLRKLDDDDDDDDVDISMARRVYRV